jgi:hypothetical protein
MECCGEDIIIEALWVAHSTINRIEFEIWHTASQESQESATDGQSGWVRVYSDHGSHTRGQLRRCALDELVVIDAGAKRGFCFWASDTSGVGFAGKVDDGPASVDGAITIHRGTGIADGIRRTTQANTSSQAVWSTTRT